MARFARPYCGTEPVRTVPFFNLYDDIQITQLGAYNDRFSPNQLCSPHLTCAGGAAEGPGIPRTNTLSITAPITLQ